MNDTPKITSIPQQTSAQRLYAFTQQLARLGSTPEFFLNKAFDYALSLPEVYRRKSQTERLEAATALLLEVAATLTAEARQHIMKQHEEAAHAQEEEQTEEATLA